MSILQIPRRGMMGSAGGESGFGFVVGSYDRVDVTAPNTIIVNYMQRNVADTVPLTDVPNIHQGDTVTVTFELVSGDEISGRFTYTFGGITVAADRTVSNWAGLSVSISANADASLAEFTIEKKNTGNYVPSSPPTVKVSVAVNGVTIM